MASPSSSSTTQIKNYDVFLSFRGEDTGRTVVSFLYEALCREGIFSFRDDRRLEAGDNISEELMKAIHTSWFAVVVISENYATSKWCLEELRLIMELHSENRIQVVPIFYQVEPSNVRHQTGSFEAMFQKYELNTPPWRVSQWKRALNQVGHISGFHSPTYFDEAAMISKAARSISKQLLDMRQLSVGGEVDLVGMEAHKVKMHFLLNLKSENDVLMIGIWGMGGIGKTTIAECLYDRLSRHFQARYFIDYIKKVYKDKSPSHLQEKFLGQRISFRSNEAGSKEIKTRLGHQKVFIVLDGVDKAEQVHALARDTSWFGPGSRIIITTRDRGLLNSCGVKNVYEVNCFDNEDALQVFKKFAFGGKPPPSDGFEQLFIRASRLAHGLPSALLAYASHLSENETIERWEDEMRSLETRPHKNVEEILRISYDNLNEQDKTAFLQVACFLNGYPFSNVASLLDDGRPRINHLTTKSLISVSTDGCINMHFLVVQTGRAIVRQESGNRPSRQRFLWKHTEIYDVLDRNIGTDETEGVTLHMCEMTEKLPLSITVFSVMHSIKFLKFFQHLRDAESSNVQLTPDCFKFRPNLKLLHWDAYPLETLPSFRYYHLVQLDLRYSNLKRLWDGTVNLWNLRKLDVTGSKNLKELPNFSKAVNLEELIVEGCLSLGKITKESLRSLRSLKKLNAINCSVLRDVKFSVISRELGRKAFILTFPKLYAVWFSYLRDLSMEGQMHLEGEDLTGNAERLSFASKQQTADQMMTKTQETETHPKSLEIMQFSYMENGDSFRCLSFRNYPYLTELKLINLNIEDIPEDISHLQFLEKLDLSGNDFKHLPTTMGQIAKLKYLRLGNCRKIKELPLLSQVETLILSDCVNLRSLPELDVEEDKNCLLELWLDNCNEVVSFSYQLRCFTKLTYLDLSRNEFVSVPESIREFSSLETLFFNNCKKLKLVEELPRSIKYLYAHGCYSLERVSLSIGHTIKHINLNHCPRLNRQEYNHFMDLCQEVKLTNFFLSFQTVFFSKS